MLSQFFFRVINLGWGDKSGERGGGGGVVDDVQGGGGGGVARP